METENIDQKATMLNGLNKTLKQAEDDVKTDGAEHQDRVTKYKDVNTKQSIRAVNSAKTKLDATKERYDAAYQALQKFKAFNAGSMEKIEKRAKELMGPY